MAETFEALSDLVNALRERHYGRMPDEVQRAYDRAWTIVFTAPAAPDPLALALEALEVVEVADLVKGVYVLDKQDMAVVLMALKSLRGAKAEGAAP